MHVELHCGLCPPTTPSIPTTQRRVYVDAVGHCLDLHRAALLADPDATERTIVVSSPRRSRTRRGTVVAA